MENITYDVRIHKMEVYKGNKITTYTVRWKTGPKPWKEPFRKYAQALSFEAELRSAPARREAFDVTTGRLVAWGRTATEMSWYDFCVSYVDMKWKGASGKHRADTAWALVTVMPAMLASEHGKPDDKKMRTALRRWAFNSKNRVDCPDDAAQILKWLSRNTKPVSALSDPKVMRAVLDRAAPLLDGSLAAPSTIQRNRAILHNACEYAMELNMLTRNPIKAIKWKAPKASPEVDRRSVVNHGQTRRLLQALQEQSPSGLRLAAFFAVLYYAGLRPEEAVNLRRENITLPPLVWNDQTEKWEEPEDDWGELHFCTAAPEVGVDRRRRPPRSATPQGPR
ncbi:hypothetical protein GCM10009678_47640 [Actinomadura kijaniata]|uniref:Integrase n=1 Tax=Actinomadura namibiensis TaxID=182080 RepID=A0A7W3LKT1_ACTNM|nr:hypothetical protein [Actinomadura namibiensis]MBA8949929.1 hypothetical protein [Actinomadura namibiensis]